MSDPLHERMREVYAASLTEESSPPPDPLERRWQEVAGYASLYFNDLYHKFPLARVLEGGTWAAGRKIARAKRADGGPPLLIHSDGTVF